MNEEYSNITEKDEAIENIYNKWNDELQKDMKKCFYQRCNEMFLPMTCFYQRHKDTFLII